jgi:hypothetical protein
MSDTKLPEAMVEAAAKALQSQAIEPDGNYGWTIWRGDAKVALTAAGVPEMLACVEALRKLEPFLASRLRNIEADEGLNWLLAGLLADYRRHADGIRSTLAAFDKSFPQPTVSAADADDRPLA